ncbi:MAG: DNA-binding response regulator VicR [Candidatus Saccharibacteria bacterium]|nr:DNA-binding response regulator VicR [Candidatus Saccharibacteria bacterium]
MNDGILTILIVEDEPALQTAYQMILSSQGYRVATANNGYEALKEINKQEPDIVLLDYFMPKMDGKTFLQNFDHGSHPDLKIILTSNISDPSVIQEMQALGITDHVLKADLSPMQLIDLVERIAAL